jgi:CRISPR-associated endonuclease/helicase Cas3
LSFDLPQELLPTIAYLAGVTHDVAKGTRFFQHYLLSPTHEVIGPKDHALLSSLLAKNVVEQYLTRLELTPMDRQLLPYLVYTAVKRHHGNLNDFTKELYLEDYSEKLIEQVENCDDGEIQSILDELLAPVKMSYSWQDFKAYIKAKKFENEYSGVALALFTFKSYSDLPFAVKNRYFYCHQLVYSTLLLSDKSDVILKGLSIPNERAAALEAVNAYRAGKGFDEPKTELDRLKHKAYTKTLAELDLLFNPEQHLYSLTLPTGLGKTLLSLAVGLALREKIGFPAGRLIVTIPFTSIIDQNYAVFEEVLGKPSLEVLLKHHHRAEPVYKKGDDTLDQDKSQFLIETWQSEIVVTTFVQLLETLFTNDKTKLLKLPNLANAIIILDEVQQVNYALWPLIRQAFQTLGQRFNCYFILMSATQPLIFLPGKEIQELVPDYRSYFRNGFFNRTRIINRAHQEVSFEAFTEDIVAYCKANRDKNVLVILNTKKHTLECFRSVVSQLEDEKSDVYYLSTLLTPFERKIIIDRIKNYQGPKQQVVISTQLIEAGVDVSVHTVFRVMAPLDSIIQAAGRANRYNEKESVSEVYLYNITELKKANGLIYGFDLLLKTANVFKRIDEIEECDYLSLIEAYFLQVKRQADVLVSSELQALQALEFKQVGKFKLIEEQQTESVFAQLNEEAVHLWEAYKRIITDNTLRPFEQKQAFALIRARFYEYVVNVPIPNGQEIIAFDRPKENFFYVSYLHSPSAFYKYTPNNFRQNEGYVSVSTLFS